MGHRSRPRADDQLLLNEHRRAAERSSKPVVSVNSDTVIANRAAVELLQQAGQEVVAWASSSSASAAAPELLRLANGLTAKVRPRPVVVEDPDAGTVLEFELDSDSWGRVRPDGPTPLAGASPQWQGVLRLVHASARGNSTVSIEGERGDRQTRAGASYSRDRLTRGRAASIRHGAPRPDRSRSLAGRPVRGLACRGRHHRAPPRRALGSRKQRIGSWPYSTLMQMCRFGSSPPVSRQAVVGLLRPSDAMNGSGAS